MHRAYVLTPRSPTWTKEKCIKDALKFDTITTWQKSPRSGYWAAQRNNWLPECTSHMKRLPVGRPRIWDLEKCKEEAKKYQCRSEWRDASSASYWAAQQNGWLDICFTHIDGKELHLRSTPPVDPLTENDLFAIMESEFNNLLGK